MTVLDPRRSAASAMGSQAADMATVVVSLAIEAEAALVIAAFAFEEVKGLKQQLVEQKARKSTTRAAYFIA